MLSQVLFTTSTRDDRVHPGHARKMVRALEAEASKDQACEGRGDVQGCGGGVVVAVYVRAGVTWRGSVLFVVRNGLIAGCTVD